MSRVAPINTNKNRSQFIPNTDISKEAFEKFKQQAAKGDILAKYNLALFYLGTPNQNNPNQRFSDIDEELAKKLFKEVAESQKQPIASYAQFYIDKYSSEEVFLQSIKEAADQGLAEAQFELGVIRYNKELGKKLGEKTSLKEAVSLFKEAADQGFPVAKYNLGAIYFRQEAKIADQNSATTTKQGFDLMKEAADLGDVKAASAVAYHYKHGVEDGLVFTKTVIKQNKSLAAKYYAKAATAHDSTQLNVTSILNLKIDEKAQDNSLNKDEILEIINLQTASSNEDTLYKARISNPKSSFIGNLVKANAGNLQLEDLLLLHQALIDSVNTDKDQFRKNSRALAKIKEAIQEKCATLLDEKLGKGKYKNLNIEIETTQPTNNPFIDDEPKHAIKISFDPKIKQGARVENEGETIAEKISSNILQGKTSFEVKFGSEVSKSEPRVALDTNVAQGQSERPPSPTTSLRTDDKQDAKAQPLKGGNGLLR